MLPSNITIYTGNGKGKTTASVGHALCAKAQGKRVLFAQFMKAPNTGEGKALQALGVDVMNFEEVLSPFFNPHLEPTSLLQVSLDALGRLRQALGDYDIAVLDEFICLVSAKVIEPHHAITFIESCPCEVELVLSGRGAPEGLLKLSGAAYYMAEVRHPFKRGIAPRRGIDF